MTTTTTTAYYDVANSADYWGWDCTDEQAIQAADALASVLEAGADAMGIAAIISVSPRGDANRGDLPKNRGQQFIDDLAEFAWQHDAVQSAGFEGDEIDAHAVLRDYDADVVRCGGISRPELAGAGMAMQ